MDELEVAPVLFVEFQCVRLAPEHASVRTHARSTRVVRYNVDYDLAVVLLPPESSPSSLSTSPWTPVASRRRERPPGASRCPPFPLPWLESSSRAAPPRSSRRRLAAGGLAQTPLLITRLMTPWVTDQWAQW